MRSLLLGLALVLFALEAGAATCTFATGLSTWSAVATVSPASNCATPTTADSFVVPSGAVVTVTGNLSGIVGSLTVQSGGVIDFTPMVSVEFRGGMVFQSGSCPGDTCQFGTRLTSSAVPAAVTHSGSTIALDFTEAKSANLAGLPWTLCSAGCATTDVRPGTLLWVNWQEFAEVDQGILQPVDGMGSMLEVTAVDVANDIVTVSLPRVEANTQTTTYTTAESVAAGRMTSLIGTAGWTVGSVGVAENNEGKIRYETIIDIADNPFNADGEFSGFLACKAGTDRCARMVYTEADYATTQEMFTTLADPRKLWAAGEQLDIYHIRLFPGNKLTPINPVKVTKTANGTADAMIVNEGSQLFTIENLWFENAWANHVPGQRNGVLAVQNGLTTDRKEIRQIYFSGCDAPDIIATGNSSAATCLSIENLDTVSSGLDVPDGDRIQNLHISDIYFAFAQVLVDFATNPTAEAFANFAIQFLEEPSQRISVEATWLGTGGRLVSDWQNVTMRRIRIEGVSGPITDAGAGRINNCEDGLFMQDILVMHARTAKPRDANHGGEDQIELFPNTQTCGVDRLTVMRSNVGTGIGPFRWARPNGGVGWGGTVYATSIVELGGPAQQGNTNDAAGRGIVNYTWPTPTPNVSPEGHTHGYPDAAGGGYYISNFIVDGAPYSLTQTYGAYTGWWTQRFSAFLVRQCGNRQVGTFTIGGSASPAQGLNGLTACAGPHTDIRYIDNYHVNLGGQTNNGSNSNCDATGGGSGVFQCDGVANSNSGAFFTTAANLSPMPSLLFDGNLYHWGAHDTAAKYFAWFGTTADVVPSLTIRNSTFLGDFANSIRIFWDNVPGVGLNAVGSVTIGPNVWAMAGSQERCDSDDDTPTDSLLCLFPAPIGDLSPDLSPHGGTAVKLAGDLANGYRLRALGSATPDSGNDASTAQPRYAGPVVWDVFSWVTPEYDSLSFRRTQPRTEYMPPVVRRRLYNATQFEAPWDPGVLSEGAQPWRYDQ